MTHISIRSLERKTYGATDTIYSITAMDIFETHTQKKNNSNKNGKVTPV